MADNIVGGLFGLNLGEIGQRDYARDSASAYQYAKLDPFQQANMSLYKGGAGFGRLGANMLGYSTPEEAESINNNNVQTQIDHTTSQGLMEGAKLFDQSGNPKMAMMYAQAARKMEEDEAKINLNESHARYYAQGGAKGSAVKNLLAQFAPALARARQQATLNAIAANMKGQELSDYVEKQVQLARKQYINDVNIANQSQTPDAYGVVQPPINIDWSVYDTQTPTEALLPSSKSEVAGSIKAAEEGEKPVEVMQNGVAVSVPFKQSSGAPLAQFSPQNKGEIKVAEKGGELTATSNEDEFKQAMSSKLALPKINGLINQLNNSNATTGMGADLIKGFNRAKALLGGEEAAKNASDTEMLDVMMGSEVFPLIQSLGLGAKGMDTPAEREFMRSVLTGAITLNKETLLEMAKIRKNAAESNIVNFNKRLNNGELDSFYSSSNRTKEPILFNASTKLDLSTPAKIKEIQMAIPLLRKTDPVAADQLLSDLKTQLKKPKLTKEQALEIAKSRGLVSE